MTSSIRRRVVIIAGLVAVVVAVVAGGLWWYLRDDAPAEVDLADAVASLEQAQQSQSADTTAPAAAPQDGGYGEGAQAPATSEASAPEDDAETAAPVPQISFPVAGRWSVDTTIGSFDFEQATGSFVGFRVDEELSGIGSVTAVGRTGVVSGEMDIDGTRLVGATIVADLSELTTNDPGRNGPARRALDTANFPEASFVLSDAVDLGGAVEDGSAVSISAAGELTIKGITRPTTFAIDAQVVGDVIVVVGRVDVVFADFDVVAPSAPIVLSVDDHGVIEFQLLFTQG